MHFNAFKTKTTYSCSVVYSTWFSLSQKETNILQTVAINHTSPELEGTRHKGHRHATHVVAGKQQVS